MPAMLKTRNEFMCSPFFLDNVVDYDFESLQVAFCISPTKYSTEKNKRQEQQVSRKCAEVLLFINKVLPRQDE
jgi:hypothetical protein